jgi:hypothetical protein
MIKPPTLRKTSRRSKAALCAPLLLLDSTIYKEANYQLILDKTGVASRHTLTFNYLKPLFQDVMRK